MDWALSSFGKRYFTNLLNNPDALCLIALEDAKPVGYIAGAPKPASYRKSLYFEIGNMGISPEYRSKRNGRQLIDACATWAKEHGYQKLFVNSELMENMCWEIHRLRLSLLSKQNKLCFGKLNHMKKTMFDMWEKYATMGYVARWKSSLLLSPLSHIFRQKASRCY